MKKFINAVIYGHNDANEILVDNGIIKWLLVRILDQQMKLLIYAAS